MALDGERTLIQQTLTRLLDLAESSDVWVITNDLLSGEIARQLPELADQQILCEPAARNTAPACALAAFLLEKTEPDTVIGIFPSDHVVKDQKRFIEVIKAGAALAASGDNIVVLGVPPTRAETGYGYIEQGSIVDPEEVPCGGVPVRRVRRFTEKPDSDRAQQFLESGDYAWNSGIFLWSARTLANSIREFCPAITPVLENIAAAYGTEEFPTVFAETYPKCQNISIDYAVLEPRSAKGEAESGIYCLPANFAWNDLGSWAALYEHHATTPEQISAEGNIVEAGVKVAIGAVNNYVYAPGKTVALVGVEGLVVVVTDDALLITTRERSQDVGKVIRALSDQGCEDVI